MSHGIVILTFFLTDEPISVVTGPRLEFITHFHVLDRYDVTLNVLGCKNGHVALSAVAGVLDVGTYDVVIGANDNTMCYINDGIPGSNMNSGECSLNCSMQVNPVKNSPAQLFVPCKALFSLP